MRDDTPRLTAKYPNAVRALLTCDYIGTAAKDLLLREFIALAARNAAMAIASNSATISATAFVIREKMTESFGLAPAQGGPVPPTPSTRNVS